MNHLLLFFFAPEVWSVIASVFAASLTVAMAVFVWRTVDSWKKQVTQDHKVGKELRGGPCLAVKTEPVDTQTHTGWWWRPEYPDDKIPGIAELQSSGSVRVDFLQTFTENIDRESQFDVTELEIRTLHGENLNGDKVTVLNCRYIDAPIIGSSPSAYSYKASAFSSRYLEGALLASEEQVVREATIEINGLFIWSCARQYIKSNFSAEALTITVQEAPDALGVSFDLDDCHVECIAGSDYNVLPGVKAEAFAQTKFRISSFEGISYERVIYIANRIGELVSLGLCRNTPLSKVKVRDIVIENQESYPRKPMLTLYDVDLDLHAESSETCTQYILDSLFDFDLLKIGGGVPVKRWIENYEQYHRVFDLYFSVERASFMHAESKFLNYVRAFEGYSHIVYPGSRFVDQDEFNAWIDSELCPMIEQKFQVKSIDDLVSRASHVLKTMGNDWPLDAAFHKAHKRRHNKVLWRRLMSTVKQPEFQSRIANTRNVLSHGMPADDRTIDTASNEFEQATQYLRILVQTALLEIMGLSLETINNVLLKRYRTGL